MCTMIAKKVTMEGSGKNSEDWFKVNQANVAYDHPYHVFREHSLNIDFVNEAEGPRCRGVERRVGPKPGGYHPQCAERG